MEILERLKNVQERIKRAALRVNRNPEEIRLIPVSKFHSVEKIELLIQAGICDFGESKVQELLEKNAILGQKVNWHLIGHLQRNKVKYIARIPNLKLIHSLDSLRLAEEIHKRCEIEGREMNVLIQVNVANDDNKFGVLAEDVVEFVTKVASLNRVKIKGLMTIVPEVDDPEEVRPYFKKLKALAGEIDQRRISGVEMKELSMGMTNDFEVAIEEGATIVRIGSAIFGARVY